MSGFHGHVNEVCTLVGNYAA